MSSTERLRRQGESPAQATIARPALAPAPTTPDVAEQLRIRQPGADRFWRDVRRRRMLAFADIGTGMVVSLLIAGSAARTMWALALLPAWVLIAKLFGLYDRDQRSIRHLTVDELAAIAAWVAACAAMLGLLLPLTPAGPVSFTAVAGAWLVGTFTAGGVRRAERWGWGRPAPPPPAAGARGGRGAPPARRPHDPTGADRGARRRRARPRGATQARAVPRHASPPGRHPWSLSERVKPRRGGGAHARARSRIGPGDRGLGARGPGVHRPACRGLPRAAGEAERRLAPARAGGRVSAPLRGCGAAGARVRHAGPLTLDDALEARLRRVHLRERPRPPRPALSARRSRHQARQPGSGVLQAAAGRQAGNSLPHVQAAHDGRQRRGWACRRRCARGTGRADVPAPAGSACHDDC